MNYYIQFNKIRSNIGRSQNNYPLVFGHFVRDIILPLYIFLLENGKNNNYYIIKQIEHRTYNLIKLMFPNYNIIILNNNNSKYNITNVQKNNYFKFNDVFNSNPKTNNFNNLENSKFNVKNFITNYINSYEETLLHYTYNKLSKYENMKKYHLSHELFLTLAFYRLNNYYRNDIYRNKKNEKYISKNVFIKRKQINHNNSASRIYINYEDYFNYVKIKNNNDIICVYLEDISFEEEVEIFSNAENIYMSYGSEIYTLYLCKNLKNVYELKNVTLSDLHIQNLHPAFHIISVFEYKYNVKWNYIPLEFIHYKAHTEFKAKILYK